MTVILQQGKSEVSAVSSIRLIIVNHVIIAMKLRAVIVAWQQPGHNNTYIVTYVFT